MFEQLKLVFQQMGQGLLQQHFGEISAAVEQIEKKSQKFHLAGAQSRIVLIASTDPLSPAFDFVVNLAKQTRSLIEVLYITPAGETKTGHSYHETNYPIYFIHFCADKSEQFRRIQSGT